MTSKTREEKLQELQDELYKNIKTYKESHFNTAKAYYNLAMAYKNSGRYIEAKNNFSEALEIYKTYNSNYDPEIMKIKKELEKIENL